MSDVFETEFTCTMVRRLTALPAQIGRDKAYRMHLSLIMAALRSRCGHYIFALCFLLMAALYNRGHLFLSCGFYLLSSSFFLT